MAHRYRPITELVQLEEHLICNQKTREHNLHSVFVLFFGEIPTTEPFY